MRQGAIHGTSTLLCISAPINWTTYLQLGQDILKQHVTKFSYLLLILHFFIIVWGIFWHTFLRIWDDFSWVTTFSSAPQNLYQTSTNISWNTVPIYESNLSGKLSGEVCAILACDSTHIAQKSVSNRNQQGRTTTTTTTMNHNVRAPFSKHLMLI